MRISSILRKTLQSRSISSKCVNIKAVRRQKPTSQSLAWKQRQEKDVFVKQARAEGRPSRAIYKLQQIDKIATNKLKQKTFKKKKKKNDSRSTKNATNSFRNSMFSLGTTVVDLGAAPGSWSLHAASKIGADGILISVDLLNLNGGVVSSIKNGEGVCKFHFIQGDFCALDIKEQIVDILSMNSVSRHSESDKNLDDSLSNRCQVDCIISDMAAKFTGDQATDAMRTINLCENALMFAVGSTCFDDDESYNIYSKDNDEKNNWQELGLLRQGGTFLCKFFACGKENENDLRAAVKRHFNHYFVLKPPASRKESAELYLYATGYKGSSSSSV